MNLYSSRTRQINTEEKLVNYIKTQLGSPLITVDVTEDQILQCIDDTFLKFSDWIWDSQLNQVFVIEAQADIKDYYIDPRVKSIYSMSIADSLSGYADGGINGMIGGVPMGSMMPPMYVPYINLEGQMSSLENAGSAGSFSVTGEAGGVTGPHSGQDGTNGGVEAFWAAMADMQTYQNLMGSHISFDFNASNHILRIFDQVQGPIMIEAALDYIPNPAHDDAYGNPFVKKYALNLVKRVWGQNVGKYSSPLVGGAEINYDRLISEAQTEIERLDEQAMMSSEALGIFSG